MSAQESSVRSPWENWAWVPVSQEPGHPLNRIQDRMVAGERLFVLLGPTVRSGARWLQGLLESSGGSNKSVLLALYHAGPFPPQNWIEVSFCGLTDTNEEALFRLLAALIPPGGHLMVEYESPQRRDTNRALEAGVPPVLTSLGFLLYQVGCGSAFKDWNFPEGGREGPRKLQGFRALNDEVARQKRSALAQEVQRFLEKSPPSSHVIPLVEKARHRAGTLLPLLLSS